MSLRLKGLNAVETHNDLAATIKDEGQSDSTIKYYVRKPGFFSLKTPQPSESLVPILNESDEAILLTLFEQPFASVPQLVPKTHIHSSTVYDHLMHKLGFTVRYLRWVPHFLSQANKHNRA
jgi:hypothetical protein